VKDDQRQDAFVDLLEQRQNASIGQMKLSLIDIASLAPKENESLKNQGSKSKKSKSKYGKSMKSSQTGEHQEELKAN
jgi:hypothetical protein